MIIKLNTERPSDALHLALVFAADYPREERGIGIGRCVIFGYDGRNYAAYWTKTMLVVRDLYT